MMKALILLFCLALLPSAFAGYYWDADTNSLLWEDDVLDENVSDANLATDFNAGPIVLSVSFDHTVIGTAGDLNAVGWFFESSEDYAFNVEAPSLELFYVLDFKTNSVYEYEGLVPVGWHPVLSLTNNTASFRVSNLLGDCDGDLFILSKRDSGLEITHLEVGEWNTIVSVGLTDFFFLFDADDFGTCTFLLDLDEFEVGVSVAFNEMPSYWAFVETKGFACEDNPDHRCLRIPGTGESWDIDECLDSANEKNRIVDGVPGIEVCVQGSLGYDAWYTETLEAKYAAEQEARALLESKSDVELAGVIGELQADISGMKDEQASANVLADEGLNEVLFAVVVLVCVVLGAFVFSRKSLPMRPITHFGGKVVEKLEEVKKNGIIRKEKGKGEGKGSKGGGEGNEGRGVAGAEGNRAEGRRMLWFRRK